MLYKQGPPFYHASYIVIVDDLDGDTLIRNQSKSMNKLTWNNLLGLERLSETAAKVMYISIFILIIKSFIYIYNNFHCIYCI